MADEQLKEWFTELSQFEGMRIEFRLEPLKELLSRMGNPQEVYSAVIIGGTNGKGSVAAMLSSILSHTSKKVGLYTSPHLVNFNERIVIGGIPIVDADVIALIKRVKAYNPAGISWFEFVTAMAFQHFADGKVDIAVLEVGMGGRLDATNVANARTCAITNISKEHQEYLGKTIEKIATEKSGIIKNNATCITCARGTKELGVIEQACLRNNAKLYKIGKNFNLQQRNDSFTYSGINRKISGITLSLKGRHQIDNAACAIALAENLETKDFNITDSAIREGLKKCIWSGRFEIVSGKPLIILDGAHNLAGMKTLIKTLNEHIGGVPLVAVLGFLQGKNAPQMVEAIAPFVQKIILTTPDSPRAVPPQELLAQTKQYHRDIVAIDNIGDALEAALRVAKECADALLKTFQNATIKTPLRKECAICVAGSLFLVGAAKKYFMAPQ